MQIEPRLEALAGLTGQFLGFRLELVFFAGVIAGGDEAGQDGGAAKRAVVAAPGDFDGVGDRLGQIGKQCDHIVRALQAVFGREAAAVVLDDIVSACDAHQGIVGLVVGRRCKMAIVGGNEGQIAGVGQLDESRLTLAFLAHGVTLDLDIEAIAEDFREPVKAGFGHRAAILQEGAHDGAVRAAGEGDQAARVFGQPLDVDVRFLIEGWIEEHFGAELHQVGIALLGRCEEGDITRDDGLGVGTAQARMGRVGQRVAEINRQRQPGNRLDAGAGKFGREFQRAEQVVLIGQGEGCELVADRELGQLRDRQRPLQERISGAHAQVHESRQRRASNG